MLQASADLEVLMAEAEEVQQRMLSVFLPGNETKRVSIGPARTLKSAKSTKSLETVKRFCDEITDPGTKSRDRSIEKILSVSNKIGSPKFRNIEARTAKLSNLLSSWPWGLNPNVIPAGNGSSTRELA